MPASPPWSCSPASLFPALTVARLSGPPQVLNLRAQRPTYVPDPRFTAVVNMIRSGAFGWEDYFAPICDAITKTDYYLVANDFAPYLDAQVGTRAGMVACGV